MTTQSILGHTGGSFNSSRETCRLRPRQQIGTATIGRREVGIPGILHGLTICVFFNLRPVSVGWEINFTITDGVCRQTHLSHDMFEHVQFIRTLVCQNNLSSQRHVSFLAAFVTEHIYTFSLTYLTHLPVVLSLTVPFAGTGSKNLLIHGGVVDPLKSHLPQMETQNPTAEKAARRGTPAPPWPQVWCACTLRGGTGGGRSKHKRSSGRETG